MNNIIKKTRAELLKEYPTKDYEVGFKDGYALAIKRLRSEPAISMQDKFSRDWADWLENQEN